jgi:hypothetical protein
MKRTDKAAGKALIKSGWLFLILAGLAHGSARAEEPKESPLVTAAKTLTLSGYAQFLAANWDPGVDSLSVRRARLGLGGELVRHLKFKLSVDLVKSPVLLDALVEFEPSKAIGFRIGQFLVPFSLESSSPTRDIDMVNRSAVVDALAPGRDIGASGRDVGAVLYGSYSIAEYSAGLFNGSGLNKADTDSHKDLSGRVVLRPFKLLSFGASIYRGKLESTPGGPLVTRNKEGIEATIVLMAFSLKSEYIHAVDDTVSKAGWYVQAGVFAVPGKLQALLRYDHLDLDRAAPDDAKSVATAGVTWFIRGATKLQVNYELHRLEAGGKEKSGLLAQFQAAF